MITSVGRGVGGAAGCVIGAVLGVLLVLIAVLWLVGNCASSVQKGTAALAPTPGMPTVAPALAPSSRPSIRELQDRGCARVGGSVDSGWCYVVYGGRKYVVLLALDGTLTSGDPADCFAQSSHETAIWHPDTHVCERSQTP